MSRRGFWYGLIAGLVLMGLVAATIAAVIFAFRGSRVGMLALHGRTPGLGLREGIRIFGFRGWAPTVGRHVKPLRIGALLCLHVPLLALGGLLLAAVIGKQTCWHRRHGPHGEWHKHEHCGPEAEHPEHDEGADQGSSAA